MENKAGGKHALISHMVHELETPYKTLSQWEEGFVISITEQWEEKHWLSDKQIDILKKLYEEKCS